MAGRSVTLAGPYAARESVNGTLFLLPSIVCVSCGYLSPCSATGRPGGWIPILAALLRGQYSAVSRTYTRVRHSTCALENGHIPVPNSASAHAAPSNSIQLCTVGIAFYILTKFQNGIKGARSNRKQ